MNVLMLASARALTFATGLVVKSKSFGIMTFNGLCPW
jgi:hypothetical protein